MNFADGVSYEMGFLEDANTKASEKLLDSFEAFIVLVFNKIDLSSKKTERRLVKCELF